MMRCVAVFLIYTLTAFSTHVFADDQKSLLAVLELTNQAKLSRGEVSTLSQFVREGAMQLPPSKYMLITKENISVILPPDMRLEDCVGECEIETGRLLGAHYILSGQVAKIGAKINISLTLHDTKTAQIKAAESVQARSLDQLKKPLRKTTIELLSKLEPSIKRQSLGLEQGLHLERRHLSMIPNFEKSSAHRKPLKSDQSVDRPRPTVVEVSAQSDLSDLPTLELLDRVVKQEQNPNSDPHEILKLWNQLKVKRGYERIASERSRLWGGYLQKIEQQKISKKNYFQQQLNEINKGFERLQEIARDDQAKKAKRIKNMNSDWLTLARLLALSVIPRETKQKLASVFVETYGVHEDLNPHMKRPELATLIDEERRAQLLRENIQEMTERFVRTAELSKQRTLLEGRLKSLRAQSTEHHISLGRAHTSAHQPQHPGSVEPFNKARPSGWYCVCYLERYRGRPTMSTACRLTMEACYGLREKVMEGTRVLVAGSAGPCVYGTGETPWEATMSSQSMWRPSKRAGAWWSPEGCFNR